MGVDVELYFQKTGELEFEREFPAGWEVCEIRDYKKEDHPEATHEFDTMSRLYSDGYERGSWPDICAVLMILHACPGVGKVWYGGDSYVSLPEFTVDDVLDLSNHFMKHGERPYRSR